MRMLSFLLVLSIIIGLFLGVHSGVPQFPLSDGDLNLLLYIRFPRIIGACIIGAGIATAGTAYQSAFKNPIVTPGILGVSAGAGVGASIAMLLGINALGLFSCIFGLLTVYIVWNIAKIISTNTVYVLVIGVIMSGIASSALSLIKFMADPNGALPAITFWLMGSLSSLRISHFPIYLLILICCIIFYKLRWRLDILNQPSQMIKSLGINERNNIGYIVLISTIISSLICSIAGVIGMVGLAIPHLVRILQGTDSNKDTMLNIQLSGALFVLWIDNGIRMLPLELPIGILTSLIGAVVFGICMIIRKGMISND